MSAGIDWRIAEAQNSCLAGIEELVQLLQQASNQIGEQRFVSLIGLLQTAHHAGRNLISGWSECDVPLLAWAARNSLEVSIWVKYVMQSESNTERFYHDWLNDAEETMRRSIQLDQFEGVNWKSDSVYADMGYDVSAPVKATAHINALRRENHFPSQKRLDIGRIAKDVGEGDVFSELNPILSKFIHATSYSVLSFPTDESKQRTGLMFLDRGFWNLIKTVGIVDTFLKAKNLPTLGLA